MWTRLGILPRNDKRQSIEMEASIFFFSLSVTRKLQEFRRFLDFRRTDRSNNDAITEFKTDLNLSWSLLENVFFTFSTESPRFLPGKFWNFWFSKNQLRKNEKLWKIVLEQILWRIQTRFHNSCSTVRSVGSRYVGNGKRLNSCVLRATDR